MSKHSHCDFTVADIELLLKEGQFGTLALRCINEDSSFRLAVLHVLRYADAFYIDKLELALYVMLAYRRQG